MRRLGVVAIVVVVAAGVGLFVWNRGGSSHQPVHVTAPVAQATAYLHAWDKRDYAAMEGMVYQPPASFVADHKAMATNLGIAGATRTAGPVALALGNDTKASATYTATLRIAGLGTWRYTGNLSFVRLTTTKNGTVIPAQPGQEGAQWRVLWAPSTLHPQMRLGLAFARTRTRGTRAAITDANGNVLAGQGAMVTIGVHPAHFKDRHAVETALFEQLGVTPAQLAKDLVGQQPDWFVPVATVPKDGAYKAKHDILNPIPGIEFHTTAGRVRPSDTFARQTLGTTHEITAEELQKLGPSYEVGDQVGSGGIEGTFEQRLAGTPSGDVRIVDAKTHALVTVLQRFRGKAPQPVATTIDPTIQDAADATLDASHLAKPAALVAIDVPSGEVRAVASRPIDGFNRALTGHYPPGSTFKIITSTAVLGTGATGSTPIDCPPALKVDGRTFHNFQGEGLGTVDFRSAFAQSCNNAFIKLVQRAGTPAMERAAAQYGFNASYDIGLPSFGGSYPAPKDLAELAESSIGQAKVEASPMQMASVAAAVARGSWKPPVLVRGTPQAHPATTAPLAPGIDATLKDFMRAVVTSGTGKPAAVPNRVVYGKTGTAEFGGGPNPPTHAWFVGFYNNTAFAVLVEGGGVGGEVAAPIAADFVSRLP